ncbi:MAG: hypothetical protein L6Q57_02535 [Alphaproteobacteria bacterium]|nr:hypothetical protein [Alphaproteobacteria bacterium]
MSNAMNLINVFVSNADGTPEKSVVVRGSHQHAVVSFGEWTVDGNNIKLTTPHLSERNPSHRRHADLPGPHVDMMWTEIRSPTFTPDGSRIIIGFGSDARIKILLQKDTPQPLITELMSIGKCLKSSSVSHKATELQQRFFETLSRSKQNISVVSAKEASVVIMATGQWALSKEIFPAHTVYPDLGTEGEVEIFRLYDITAPIQCAVIRPENLIFSQFDQSGGPGQNEPTLSLLDSKRSEQLRLFATRGFKDPNKTASITKAVTLFNQSNHQHTSNYNLEI